MQTLTISQIQLAQQENWLLHGVTLPPSSMLTDREERSSLLSTINRSRKDKRTVFDVLKDCIERDSSMKRKGLVLLCVALVLASIAGAAEMKGKTVLSVRAPFFMPLYNGSDFQDYSRKYQPFMMAGISDLKLSMATAIDSWSECRPTLCPLMMTPQVVTTLRIT